MSYKSQKLTEESLKERSLQPEGCFYKILKTISPVISIVSWTSLAKNPLSQLNLFLYISSILVTTYKLNFINSSQRL